MDADENADAAANGGKLKHADLRSFRIWSWLLLTIATLNFLHDLTVLFGFSKGRMRLYPGELWVSVFVVALASFIVWRFLRLPAIQRQRISGARQLRDVFVVVGCSAGVAAGICVLVGDRLYRFTQFFALNDTIAHGIMVIIAISWLRDLGKVDLGLAGRCPACGYDLRASPERCPECGTDVKPR